MHGHIRYVYIWCTYSIFGREITMHTAIYGMYIYNVHTVFLAGKSPCKRPYTVCMYIWCTYGIFNREITMHTVIYSMYIYTVLANPNNSS